MSGTIEENITFGLEYDESWFQRAIAAAALTDDLLELDKGALTVIGEKGINISGGQRARISFARAIYQDADIYLLDDPLSAVDPKVANKLFEGTIKGLLSSKCVVLVTHQLQFLPSCARVLVLRNGEQSMLGSYDELVKAGFSADQISDE